MYIYVFYIDKWTDNVYVRIINSCRTNTFEFERDSRNFFLMNSVMLRKIFSNTTAEGGFKTTNWLCSPWILSKGLTSIDDMSISVIFGL